MANPATRQQLIDYCLRQLGAPVLEINVDDDQIEDRIDEAFQYYRDFHFDAVEKVYLSEQVSASVLTITGVNAGSYINGVEETYQYDNIDNIPQNIIDLFNIMRDDDEEEELEGEPVE